MRPGWALTGASAMDSPKSSSPKGSLPSQPLDFSTKATLCEHQLDDPLVPAA